jgi:hypothetical protein
VIRSFALDLVELHYRAAQIHFPFFPWAVLPPDPWIVIELDVLAVAGVCIALGACTRLALVVAGVGFTHLLLAEKVLYQNHHYLICLLALLLLISPAHRLWSVDARMRPGQKLEVGPAWPVQLLRAQLAVVYLYATVAKLNADWLVALEPVRTWMQDRAQWPLLGPLLAHDVTAALVAYGGLLHDALIVPALLWPRTRRFAFIITCGFHLANTVLWPIDVFPALMIGASTLYLPQSWPRRFVGRPVVVTGGFRVRRPAAVLLTAYLAVQILVPLRHHLYAGDVAWTEEGHRFSWRMMVRRKITSTRFYAREGARTEVIDAESMVSRWQWFEMAMRPDIVRDFAAKLHEERPGQQIYAVVECSLNGHPARLLLDPSVDLGRQARSPVRVRYILDQHDDVVQARARAAAAALARAAAHE